MDEEEQNETDKNKNVLASKMAAFMGMAFAGMIKMEVQEKGERAVTIASVSKHAFQLSAAGFDEMHEFLYTRNRTGNSDSVDELSTMEAENLQRIFNSYRQRSTPINEDIKDHGAIHYGKSGVGGYAEVIRRVFNDNKGIAAHNALYGRILKEYEIYAKGEGESSIANCCTVEEYCQPTPTFEKVSADTVSDILAMYNSQKGFDEDDRKPGCLASLLDNEDNMDALKRSPNVKTIIRYILGNCKESHKRMPSVMANYISLRLQKSESVADDGRTFRDKVGVYRHDRSDAKELYELLYNVV